MRAKLKFFNFVKRVDENFTHRYPLRNIDRLLLLMGRPCWRATVIWAAATRCRQSNNYINSNEFNSDVAAKSHRTNTRQTESHHCNGKRCDAKTYGVSCKSYEIAKCAKCFKYIQMLFSIHSTFIWFPLQITRYYRLWCAVGSETQTHAQISCSEEIRDLHKTASRSFRSFIILFQLENVLNFERTNAKLVHQTKALGVWNAK